MNDRSENLMSHPATTMPQPQAMNRASMPFIQQRAVNQIDASGGIDSNPPSMFVPTRGFQSWNAHQLESPYGYNGQRKFNNRNNCGNWKGKNAEIPFPKGYNPPSLSDLQIQNRLKTRRFFHPKKKFNDNNGSRYYRNNRFAPYAPRNTSSFIIRAKKAGGIAELVSPCAVTPAVLPTPIFSPSREVLGDMAKEEWGVDGYGSMNGLIRLRSPPDGGEDDDDGNCLSESDVEEHAEVERRLDHDLSRFEMIYPAAEGDDAVDDQENHIAQLEEENLSLKERMFLMERELSDLRIRLQFLERRQLEGQRDEINEEIVENGSENDEENESTSIDMEYAGGRTRDIA